MLGEDQFGPGLVGGKSANLAALRTKLPQGCAWLGALDPRGCIPLCLPASLPCSTGLSVGQAPQCQPSGIAPSLAPPAWPLPDRPRRRVQAPASIALPFGTFERVLKADCNRGVAAVVAAEERSAVSAAQLSSLRSCCFVAVQPRRCCCRTCQINPHYASC